MKTIDINAFVNSYLHTASWVECEPGECTDFTKEAKGIAKYDCLQFIELCKEEFGEEKAMDLLTMPGNDLEYLAPHDLYLTRNRHGAGFWDKEQWYGKKWAAKLTELAIEMGESTAYHVRGRKSKLTF